MEDDSSARWGFTSGWTRRLHYVAAGRVRPAAEAPPEQYDPFAAYYAAQEESSERHPAPHVDLARLDLEDEGAIAGFCSRWGLLGVYAHQPEEIVLAATVARSEQRPELTSLVWVTAPVSRLLFRNQQAPREPGDIRDPVVRRWFAGLRGEPSMLVLAPSGDYEERSPLEWPRLVPDVLHWRGWVMPHEEPGAAAEVYSESLADFRLAAIYFQQCWDLCVRLKRRGAFGPGDRGQLAREMRRHLVGVEEVVEPASEAGDETGWKLAWRFPSLLAACYKMLQIDFAGRYPRRCANEPCSRFFVAGRADRLYCTKSCLAARRQRDHRRRKRERAAAGTP